MAQNAQREPIEDIVDFYKRWPELRSGAEQIIKTASLDEDQKALMQWMVFVIDRVGPADIATDDEN